MAGRSKRLLVWTNSSTLLAMETGCHLVSFHNEIVIFEKMSVAERREDSLRDDECGVPETLGPSF